MSTPFFTGLPYRFKQIYDLIVAANLANIDATISSRMAATDGATKADGYDSALASKLDTNVDAPISTVTTNVGQVLEAPSSLLTPGTATINSTTWAEIDASNHISLLKSSSTSVGYATHLDVSGRGYIDSLFFIVRNTSVSTAYDFGARITIDGSAGNVFHTINYSIPLNQYRILGFCGLGGYTINAGNAVYYTTGKPYRYLSNLKIESYGEAGNIDRDCFYSYTPTS